MALPSEPPGPGTPDGPSRPPLSRPTPTILARLSSPSPSPSPQPSQPSPSPSQPSTPESILYASADGSIVVVDIPRSIEEAQHDATLLKTTRPTRRLLSSRPRTDPFPTPPGAVDDNVGRSLAARLAELTTEAAASRALAELADAFGGPWCLTRHVRQDSDTKDAKDDLSVHIPPGARFLQGTIDACRGAFLAEAPLFDVVVLDPPWPNRSARRRRQGRKRKRKHADNNNNVDDDDGGTSYDTMRDMDAVRALLHAIPLGAKLASSANSLVAVWVTNKDGCEALLTHPRTGLFRAWGVEPVAVWTWLKVTAGGAPVVPVDAAWRKPWERLLLARRVGSRSTSTPVPDRVLVGVPDVHSRKPSLRALLAPYAAGPGTPESAVVGLEVFARSLTAGWWAWGDEALLFQHASWWVEETAAVQ